jgi:starch synthase
MRALVIHPGTQYSFHLARELYSRGCLHRLWTGFAVAEASLAGSLIGFLPASIQRRMATRMATGLPGARLRTQPRLEWRAMRGLRTREAEAVFFERNLRFQVAIPAREIAAADVVIGFDTSSWLLARRTKAMGKPFILDQSIGHPAIKEQVFEQLRERFPDWISTIPKKSAAHLAAEREEHELADLIVVPSSFVKDTLVAGGVNAEKIRTIPFGTDLELFRPSSPSDRCKPRAPLVFLFVGSVTARKGVPILLEAWRRMDPTIGELWLVGPGSIPAQEHQKLPASVKVLGMKSRDELAMLLRQADVFVFPSFFEGLAQVQLEALAAGLPVIATREAGAGEIIKEGETGFLVPVGNASVLADRMLQLANDAPMRLKFQRAVAESRSQLSWQVYGDRWSELLGDNVLKSNGAPRSVFH